MGYGIRSGTIRTFWPDDTETKIHIQSDFSSITLAELLEKIEDNWPGASAENIKISVEKIHTDCLGYDLYDPSDYTDFIIIERVPGG